MVGTIAQSVSFSVQPDDLMELIYTQTNRVLDARNFYIALHDPLTRTLRFAFYVENGQRQYPEDVWPDTDGLTGLIVRTGQPIVTDDYLAECERRGPARRPTGQGLDGHASHLPGPYPGRDQHLQF